MRLLSFILVIVLCSACNGPALQPLDKVQAEESPPPVVEKYATAKVQFNSNASILVYGAMLVLAIIDHSGSNYKVPYLTDPQATRRYDPMVELCRELLAQANPKIFAGLVTFGTNAFVRQPITNNMTTVCGTLETQRELKEDLGWTNYLGSLQTGSDALSAFLTAHQNDEQRTKIVVAFITDGKPKTIDNQGNVITQSSTLILNQVTAMRQMVLGHSAIVDEFSFHTAYYDVAGQVDPEADTLLRAMAAAGNNNDGSEFYTKFVNGEKLDVNAFLPPKLVRSHHVNQAWTMGSVAWELVDGKTSWTLDTDMDGLSDNREATLGCNPADKDTNHNGIYDLEEYRMYGDCDKARSPVCPHAADLDSDNDFINDCAELALAEKLQLPLNRLNPVSSGSGIPDVLAFRNNLWTVAAAQGDPDLDGMDSARELSIWLPPFFPSADLIFRGLVHRLRELSIDADGVRKFLWEISKIPVLKAEENDKIRFMFPQYVDGSTIPTLKSVEKAIGPGLHVSVEASEFH